MCLVSCKTNLSVFLTRAQLQVNGIHANLLWILRLLPTLIIEQVATEKSCQLYLLQIGGPVTIKIITWWFDWLDAYYCFCVFFCVIETTIKQWCVGFAHITFSTIPTSLMILDRPKSAIFTSRKVPVLSRSCNTSDASVKKLRPPPSKYGWSSRSLLTGLWLQLGVYEICKHTCHFQLPRRKGGGSSRLAAMRMFSGLRDK